MKDNILTIMFAVVGLFTPAIIKTILSIVRGVL